MSRRIDVIAERLRRESDPNKTTDEKLDDGSTAEWIVHAEQDVAWLLKRTREFISASRKVLAGLNARIEQADPHSVPVFDGIAELHAALQRTTGDVKNETDN